MPKRSTQRLSDRAIKGMALPDRGAKIVYDADLPGFGIRLTKAGARAFVFNYMVNRRERRMTIGPFPTWSTTAARERARGLKREVNLGDDPLGDMQNETKAVLAERRAPIVQDLCERYCEEHLPTKAEKSAEDDRRMWRDFILPALGTKKVHDITPSDVDHLHARISRTRKVRANRVVALLRKALSLSRRWGWRVDNPAMGVKLNRETPRDRFLTHDELDRLTKALADHPEQASSDAIRMLMLTGARRSEVLQATWDQFDLDQGIWQKPSAHTKQRRVHRVPLSAPALDLLRRRRDITEGDFVFPGRRPGQALSEIKRCWLSVCRTAGLAKEAPVVGDDGSVIMNADGTLKTKWTNTIRLHDLRHTYASLLASEGQSLPIIGALLGHTQPQTTARYAHLLDSSLRAATERVGDQIIGKPAS